MPYFVIYFQMMFEAVVVDESQLLGSGPASWYFHSIVALQCDYRICLTGTSIRTGVKNTENVLRFLNVAHLSPDMRQERIAIETMATIRETDGIDFFPEVQTEVLNMRGSIEEQMFYVTIAHRANQAIDQYLAAKGNKRAVKSIDKAYRQAVYLQRLASILPYTAYKQKAGQKIWKDHNMDDIPSWSSDESTMMKWLRRTMDANPDKSFVVFSDHVSIIHDVTKIIKKWGVTVDTVTGKMAPKKQTLTFNKAMSDDHSRVMVMTTGVGSQSLNLKNYDWCVFLGPSYIAGTIDQALARVYRRGQLKNVRITHLLMKNTYDALVFTVCCVRAQLLLLQDRGVPKDEIRFDPVWGFVKDLGTHDKARLKMFNDVKGGVASAASLRNIRGKSWADDFVARASEFVSPKKSELDEYRQEKSKNQSQTELVAVKRRIDDLISPSKKRNTGQGFSFPNISTRTF
jgi:hypothetical protein